MMRLGWPFAFAEWRGLLPGLLFWFEGLGGVGLVVGPGCWARPAVQSGACCFGLDCLDVLWLFLAMVHRLEVCLSLIRLPPLLESSVLLKPLRRLPSVIEFAIRVGS